MRARARAMSFVGVCCALDESVKQNHLALGYAKDNAANLAVGQIDSDFPQPAGKAAAIRHPDWPSEFDSLNRSPYQLAVGHRQP